MSKKRIHYFTVISIILSSAYSFAAQNTVKDEEESSGSDPKITLKLTYPPGKYVVHQGQVMDMNMKIQQGGNTQNQAVKQKQDMWMGLDVSSPDSSGNKKATMTFTRMRQEMNIGPQNIIIDTADEKTMKNNMMAGAFLPLMKIKLTMTISPEGKVIEIKGMEEYFKNLAKQNPQMAQQMKQSLGDKALARIYTQVFDMSPKKPIGVGAVWYSNIKMPVPMMGDSEIKTKYKLQKIHKDQAAPKADIAVHAKMEIKDGKGANVNNMNLKVSEMSMDMKGNAIINIKTGMLSKQSMDIVGGFKMSIKGPQGPVNMDGTFKGKQNVTFSKATK